MKATKIKISVSQDGLLPQESIDLTTITFPSLPKRLLRALGFERVDNTTFVGVMPVFVNLADKDQEIEIELGVSLPEMRKKVLELFQQTLSITEAELESEPVPEPKKTKKTTKKPKKTTKSSTKTAKSTKSDKATPKKKTTTKKATAKKTTAKKTKG